MFTTPQPSHEPASADLHSIQWLRAIAALAVVVFHLLERLPSQGHIGGVALGLPGAAGVDIFFCISGFIMHTIAMRRPIGPAAFLRARAIRIIPLYWLITTVLVAGALLRPHWFGKLSLHWDHVLTSYLFIPWQSPIDGLIAPLLAPGWTLNYEMFFYLIFALCLFAPAARRLHALTAVLLALVALGLILQPSSEIAKVYTNQLLLEFLAGAWIGELWRRGRLVLSGRTASVMAIAGATALLATAPLGTAIVDQYRALVWGLPALLILVAAVSQEHSIRTWPKIGVRIGDTSYSLYLIHGIVIALVAKSVGLNAASSAAIQWLYATVTIAACLVAGWLCWRFVEQPIAASLRTKNRSRHRRPETLNRPRAPA